MNSPHVKLELLAPARDLSAGLAAINSGADAVYIGGPGFGARAAAGNPVADIATLAAYAHQFGARVYGTVNTLLTDEQMPEAVALIHQLYDAGVDAVIIQDAGLLNQPLPPLPLHASTQFNNFTPAKVKFLEQAGVSRVVLARELTLAEIAAIRAQTRVELEFFVHGALCVSLSGQCYLSQAISGRSANRGECAQPCRSWYSLYDGNGQMLERDRHLLSLKDLNLSAHLAGLVHAGITSFKIEGRLKDESYVRNITAHYSHLLDRFIEANPGFIRASQGKTVAGFDPDPERSFNRGFTTYFIEGRQQGIHSPDGGKALGKYIGTVTQVRRDHVVVNLLLPVANGDGLSFVDRHGQQRGVRVNRADGSRLYTLSNEGITEGTQLYRNHDHAFETLLQRTPAIRKLEATATLNETPDGISLTLQTTGNLTATIHRTIEKIPLTDGSNFQTFATGQITKTGPTIFTVAATTIHCRPLLLKASMLNAMRREALELLIQQLTASYRRPPASNPSYEAISPESHLDFRGNVLNQWARQFYEEHGATVSEAGFESGLPVAGKPLMTTRHCLRYAKGVCLKEGHRPEKPGTDGSWWLTGHQQVYRLHFDCRRCLMEVVAPAEGEIVPLHPKPSAK